ncbi:MAG: hypothetical protein M5T52_22430 [Ignavibacteriaceae bacterium]|nr:hypothetical protein [Ignavibacteriaceae bacterium]
MKWKNSFRKGQIRFLLKDLKLLSYWSGIKKTNSDGTVTVSLNIPQFNGEVRLMAVAYTDSKFGSAENKIKVADDLILEPQVPRFLAVNDSLVTPVSLINTTDKAANVEVSINVEGPLKITSSTKKQFSLNLIQPEMLHLILLLSHRLEPEK